MSKRFYTSSNGDAWELVRLNGCVRVRHHANAASGGHATDYELVSFLSLFHHHPQAEELVKLIGSFVDEAPAATAP